METSEHKRVRLLVQEARRCACMSMRMHIHIHTWALSFTVTLSHYLYLAHSHARSVCSLSIYIPPPSLTTIPSITRREQDVLGRSLFTLHSYTAPPPKQPYPLSPDASKMSLFTLHSYTAPPPKNHNPRLPTPPTPPTPPYTSLHLPTPPTPPNNDNPRLPNNHTLCHQTRARSLGALSDPGRPGQER